MEPSGGRGWYPSCRRPSPTCWAARKPQVLAAAQWLTVLAFLVVGLVLSHLRYQAAVSQALELGSLIRVGFDLYGSEILAQLHLKIPSDLAAERALWQRLTAEVLGPPDVVRTGEGHPSASADSSPAG
jgi:hypothetical protein